ncbi:MAG: TonB-dependent receptor [Bacteroidota bacterium]
MNIRGASIKTALMELQKQSAVKFIFDKDIDKYSSVKVTLSDKDITIKKAIELILKSTNLQYVQMDDHVMVNEKPAPQSPNASAGQGPGTIKGRIVEFETSQPLPGASVYIVELQKGLQSNTEGYYRFNNLPAGKYTLKVTYISYRTETVQVEVKADREEIYDVKLQGSNALNEVIVSSVRKSRAPVAHTSDKQIVQEIRMAQSVVSGISSEQISKSADRNAAEAVRKISGVSIRDDKFIVIRGLNERYNLTYLNDNVAPSTELYTRAFSLDLLPTRIIDRIMVYKSPAPDLLADMTGGAVKIYTKDAAAVKHLDVELQLGVRPNTTFKNNFLTYQGSGTDFLGFDNGTRKLPNSVPGFGNFTRANISQQTYVETFSPYLQYGFKTALPLMQLTGNYYNTIKLGGRNLSMLSSLSYKNESQQQDFSRIQSSFNNDERTHNLTGETQSQQVAQLTLLQNFSYKLGDSSRLTFKNFVLQQGQSGTVVRTADNNQHYGFWGGETAGPYWSPNSTSVVNDKNIILGYTQRFLYSGNLGSNHKLDSAGKHLLSWNAGYIFSRQSIPDQRVIRLQNNRQDYTNLGPGDASLHWIGAIRSPDYGSANGSNEVDRGIISRTWSRNTEMSYNAAVDYVYKIKPWATFKAGTYQQWKERVLFRRTYTLNEGDLNSAGYPDTSPGGNGNYMDFNRVIFKEQDLGKIWSGEYLRDDGVALKIYDRTRGSDAYTATEQNNSGYAALSILALDRKLDIYGGVRAEYNRQKVAGALTQGAVTSPLPGGVNTPILIDNNKLSVLPSVNVGYRPNEQWVLRGAYGKTVNRPEFRELSPYSELDYLNNQTIFGNSKLISADISNYDLRLEWYNNGSKSNTLSVGAFYKDMQNPIERITARDLNYSSPASITFANANKATVKGLELDIRQDLGFIPANVFRNLSIIANATVIKSEVTRDVEAEDVSGGIQNSAIKRQLQGQAPYIINAGLYYDDAARGTKIAVLYNQVGPRIYAAAIGKSFQDANGGGYVQGGTVGSLIELTRRQIDLSISQRLIKSLQLKFSIQNLLNQPIRMAEDENFTYKYEKAVFTPKATNTGQTGSFQSYDIKGDLISSEYRSDRFFNLGITYSF